MPNGGPTTSTAIPRRSAISRALRYSPFISPRTWSIGRTAILRDADRAPRWCVDGLAQFLAGCLYLPADPIWVWRPSRVLLRVDDLGDGGRYGRPVSPVLRTLSGVRFDSWTALHPCNSPLRTGEGRRAAPLLATSEPTTPGTSSTPRSSAATASPTAKAAVARKILIVVWRPAPLSAMPPRNRSRVAGGAVFAQRLHALASLPHGDQRGGARRQRRTSALTPERAAGPKGDFVTSGATTGLRPRLAVRCLVTLRQSVRCVLRTRRCRRGC